MPPQLSPLTQQVVERLFEPSDQAEAIRRLVEKCGNNLPFCADSDEYKLERIRFATLRLSMGYPADLEEAISLANRDWRDVLVWAGFGENLTAHQAWAEQLLKGTAQPMVIIIMGVTGAGKTTVGSLLARRLGWMYYETDNFLPTEDFNRFIRGEPLPDPAIETWLAKIRVLINKYLSKKQNAVMVCSALKESYRQALGVNDVVRFVYLRGEYAQIQERQKKRKSDLSYLERLRYQYSILQEPADALVIDSTMSPQEIVEIIRRELKV